MTQVDEHEIKHDNFWIYSAPKMVQRAAKPPRMRVQASHSGKEPALSGPLMRDIFYARFEDFLAVPGAKLVQEGDRRHIFIDRGSPVLGVAHLDSVAEATHFWMNDQYIASPVVDDRIGAWAMLQGVPSMGFYPDILLTDGEEKGQSTGKDFKPSKQYNWLFSFDRTGDDVACYQYLDEAWRKELLKFGLRAVYGANSDIGYMEDVGVKAMNIGCGMYDYHGPRAYVKTSELLTQMRRFRQFCVAHWTTHFPHTKGKVKTYYPNYGRNGYDEDYLFGGGSVTRGTNVRLDNKLMETIMKELRAQRVTLSEWWCDHAQPKSGEGHKTYCRGCEHFFSYKDTDYSMLKAGMYCNACFLLEMIGARVLDDDDFVDFVNELRALSKVKEAEIVVVEEGGTL